VRLHHPSREICFWVPTDSGEQRREREAKTFDWPFPSPASGVWLEKISLSLGMPELEKFSHSLGMPKDVMDFVTVIVASFCQWSIKLHKLEQALRCDQPCLRTRN
jgi:hypothetical protein